jgi:hypothetical protein
LTGVVEHARPRTSVAAADGDQTMTFDKETRRV